MSRLIHLCIDISGALRNMENKKSSSQSYFNHNDGRPMTVGEARNELYSGLSKGRKVLPMGECDNFDYQVGCLGHEVDED